MALAAMRVPTIFTAQDKFSAVINTMTKNTRGFAAGMSRLDNRVNSSFNSMSRFSQMAFGLGAGAVFLKAGNDIIEYEKKINSLSAVTGTAIGSMTQQIESLGRETSRSVIDIAGSFEIVGSKMSEYLDNPDALKKITGASILMAEAARMELEPAISSLTGVMNIYQKSAEDAYNVVNKLSAGETIGSVSIAQTADILPQFGAQAVRANVTLEESIALVQILTKSLDVEGVGRGLRNILFDISSTKTWDKNRWKAIKMAGVDFEFVTNNANKLVDRLRELKKLQTTKGGVELFFKRVNSIAANTLFQEFDKGESSFVSFLDKTIKLSDAQEKANKNNATFATLWARTKDAFTNYIVVQDKTNSGLEIMKGLLGWMKDNMRSIINLTGAVVVAFLGWKAIVTVVSIISGLMTALNAIMGVHRFIVLWATLTNATYATSLWAVTVATLAAYWPLLLIAGALGLLVYAFWDSGNAADDMVQKQITALNKGNLAMSNSTDVMGSELQKQLNLQNGFNKKMRTDYDTPWYGDNRILEDVDSKVAPLINKEIDAYNRTSLFDKRVTKEDYTKVVPNIITQKSFINPKAISTNTTDFSKFNLAGKKETDVELLARLLNVNVNVNNENGETKSVEVNGKEYPKNVSAKTGTTTGLKAYIDSLN